MSVQPLAGLKVLDFTHYLAGPYCTMVLADLGADVVKVERTRVGEDGRRVGTTFIDGDSALWLALNRNKRSFAANLKDEGDRALVQRLAAVADVIVENYRPGALKRLGLGYEDVRATNEKVILVTPFFKPPIGLAISIAGSVPNGKYRYLSVGMS